MIFHQGTIVPGNLIQSYKDRKREMATLPVIGTLGGLNEAAAVGLVDLRACVSRLRTTSFYVAPEVLKNLLKE